MGSVYSQSKWALNHIIQSNTEIAIPLSQTRNDEKENAPSCLKEEPSCLKEEPSCLKEVTVNEYDGRILVYESHIATEPIIKCIGQLVTRFSYRSRYNEKKHSDYSITQYGTGTVYYVDEHQTAYILTCAHNIRHTIKECVYCFKWMENSERKCIRCKRKKFQKKMIEATNIQFNRRITENGYSLEVTEHNRTKKTKYEFGQMEKAYKANCFYIDDEKYNQYSSVKDGYDIAILSFTDSDNYYSKYCEEVCIQNGKSAVDDNIESVIMFGYPAYPKQHILYGKMVGMESTDHDFEVALSTKSGEWYLKQHCVDASKGQSGSSLFYMDENQKPVIFGVHTGGSDKYKYNAATLIDDTILNLHTPHPIPNISDTKCVAINNTQCVIQWTASLCEQDINTNVKTKLFMQIKCMNDELDNKETEEIESEVILFDKHSNEYQSKLNGVQKDTYYKMEMVLFERKSNGMRDIKKSLFFKFKTSRLNYFYETEFIYRSDYSRNGLCIDFGVDLRIKPKAYTLRQSNGCDYCYLRNWCFLGSNDGETWFILTQHENHSTFHTPGESHTFELKSDNKYYRFFKIEIIGKNLDEGWSIYTTGFELYGRME